MRDLTITLVQTELYWQDPAANRRHFEELLAGASTLGKLIILPEMFTTGFTMDARACAETMGGESVAWMAATAGRLRATLCGSLVIEDSGRFYNRLIWMPPDGSLSHYDKRHLFRMADEQHHYAAGTKRKIFELGGWRICPLVCYDLRFPVWSRGVNAFDLLLYVANWPAPRRSAWDVLLPARAVENQCYVAGVNRIGTDGNEVDYAGYSVVVDYFGRPVVDCGDRDQCATAALSGSELIRYREKFPAWQDADPFTFD